MLEQLFGGKTAEGIILYILTSGSGYIRGIASQLDLEKSQVDRTIKRLEAAGILVSKLAGRTRVFELNPRLAYKKELTALVDKAMSVMPDKEREKYIVRTRPRRTGKSLK